jgi:hypothetical protein
LVETAISPAQAGRRASPLPYLVVGIVWFILFLIASRIRTIEPIYLWIATQSLIAERLLGGAKSITFTLFFLAIYLLAGTIGWLLVERSGSDREHVWRRAVVTWLGIQLAYAILATILVQIGVIYE